MHQSEWWKDPSPIKKQPNNKHANDANDGNGNDNINGNGKSSRNGNGNGKDKFDEFEPFGNFEAFGSTVNYGSIPFSSYEPIYDDDDEHDEHDTYGTNDEGSPHRNGHRRNDEERNGASIDFGVRNTSDEFGYEEFGKHSLNESSIAHDVSDVSDVSGIRIGFATPQKRKDGDDINDMTDDGGNGSSIDDGDDDVDSDSDDSEDSEEELQPPPKTCGLLFFDFLRFIAVMANVRHFSSQMIPLFSALFFQSAGGGGGGAGGAGVVGLGGKGGFDGRMGVLHVALRIFMASFSLLLIALEFPHHFPILHPSPPSPQSPQPHPSPFQITQWLPRGILYIFLSIVCFEQVIVVRALDADRNASNSSRFFDGIFIVLSAWVMLVIGVVYVVLGGCCLQGVMERVRREERERWEVYRERVRKREREEEEDEEEEEEREWLLDGGESSDGGGRWMDRWWRCCRRFRRRGRRRQRWKCCRGVDWKC